MDKNLKLLQAIVKGLDDKKGIDIKVLKVDDLTVLTDYFVICNGSSTTQVKALADNAEVESEKLGERVLHREGYDNGEWILLDYGVIIVHVFKPESRSFYKMENVWADGKEMNIEEIISAK